MTRFPYAGGLVGTAGPYVDPDRTFVARIAELTAERDALRAELARLRKPNDVPAHAVGTVRIVDEAVAYARERGASPEVIALLASRAEVGLRRYGLPLTEATPIDARTYALEEAADAVVYTTLMLVRGYPEAHGMRALATSLLEALAVDREVTP